MIYFLCRFPFHLLILSPLPLPPWTYDWRVFLGWLIGFPPPRQRDIMTPASLAISRQTRTYIRSKTPGLSLSLLLIYETNLSFTLILEAVQDLYQVLRHLDCLYLFCSFMRLILAILSLSSTIFDYIFLYGTEDPARAPDKDGT